MENVVDRVSYLNNLYLDDSFQASIVVVLHGDEIPDFRVPTRLRRQRRCGCVSNPDIS
jgi:hypothetical protein